MAEQRPRGYGSVQVEGNGYRAYGREVQEDGSKKTVRKRFASETEAWDWLDALNRRNRNRAASTGFTVPETVADLMRAWLTSKDEQRRVDQSIDEKTVGEYRSIILDYLVGPIGSVPLDSPDLKAHLRRLRLSINDAVSSKTGRSLSASRKRNIWVPLKSSFRYGVKQGWLSQDPSAAVGGFQTPKANPREKVVPSEDIQKLRAFLQERGCDHKNHVCQLRWELALDSGRRQGEVLALSWNNVHLAEKPGESYMEVTHKAKTRPWQHGCQKVSREKWACNKRAQDCPQRHGGGIHIEEGTKGGVSIKPLIPLDENLVKLFIQHKKAQQREQEAAVRLRTKDIQSAAHESLVFTQPLTQRPYGSRHDATIFERLMKQAGVTGHYHIHQLRHTAATELSDATNGNLPVIADILGHKAISTTMGYISPDIDARKQALEAVRERRKRRSQHG